MESPKNIVGLDFETYFDKDYTLRKLSTSEYVRDPRFKAQCVGIRTNRQRKARWYGPDRIGDVLREIDWSKTALLAHNAAFDGLILSHHYEIVPKYYLCSMSMARGWLAHDIGAGLDEASKLMGGTGKEKKDALEATKGIRDLSAELLNPLGAYCADDVDDMWHIYRRMVKQGFPKDELDLIHLTIEAFADPVLQVDIPRAQAELKREIQRRKRLIKKAQKIIGTTSFDDTQQTLSSNQKFAAALEAEGVVVPYKAGKNGPIPALAKGDREFQTLAADKDPRISTLIEARMSAKSTIGETRAKRLIDHAKPALPIMLNYCRAHTFRWSGGDKLNPQNFPAGRKGQTSELRKSIVAPKGYVLVVVDSSQIEDRMNCFVAGQHDVLELYRTDADPYGIMADKIFGEPEGTITKKTDPGKRNVGKVARLGLGYQCGPPKFSTICETGALGPVIEMPEPQAIKVVGTYRRNNTKIVDLWKTAQTALDNMLDGKESTYTPPGHDQSIMTFHPDGIDMPNGLTLHYPDLEAGVDEYDHYTDFTYRSGKNTESKIYGGKLVENWTQALARIVVGQQMLRIAERYRVVMMTHDEVIYLAPYRERHKALNFGIEQFAIAPDWCSTLPVAGEGGWAKEYSK